MTSSTRRRRTPPSPAADSAASPSVDSTESAPRAGRVVLVTGVSRQTGGDFARALSAAEGVDRVIGVDIVPPAHSIGRADFVRADIRNPMIGRVIAQTGVDTVVHMSVLATPTRPGARAAQKETNVIGTMQLLAACQAAPALRRLVVKSSSSVYGASPRDPAHFTEDSVAKVLPRSGFGKDSVDVEGYVRGFSRRRPEVEVAVLRFANLIGPRIRTAMTDYFSLPVVPVPFGFDARLQFVHEDDATAALVRATLGPPVGVVNIAGDGVVTAQQCVALCHRPMLPVPFSAGGLLGSALRQAGLADIGADQVAALTYGRALDTRRMREVLGLEPSYTSREAFDSFAATLGPPVPRRLSGVLRTSTSAGAVLGDLVAGLGGRLSPSQSPSPSPRPDGERR